MNIFKSLVPLLFSSCLSFHLNAQMATVHHEIFAVDGVAGYTTYRLFVDLENPGDILQSVFAVADHSLLLGSSENQIYNDEFGATVGDALNTAFCQFVPTLCFDSFVSIGWVGDSNYLEENIDCGQGTVVISSTPTSTIISDTFGTEISQNLELEDGAWFTTMISDCIDNGYGVGPNNSVLIAQVTLPSDQDIVYRLNLQIAPNGDFSSPLFMVWDAPTLEIEVNGNSNGLVYPPLYCSNPEACNYAQTSGEPSLEVCDYSCWTCQDSEAINYLAEGGTFLWPTCAYENEFSISIEPTAVHISPFSDGIDLTGYVTYNVWLNCPEHPFGLSSVSSGSLGGYIHTTGSFWQSDVGSAESDGIDSTLFELYPSLIYDSFVTVNSSNLQESGGVGINENPDDPWTDAFELGNGINLSSGEGWFNEGNTFDAISLPDGHILLAQLTSDGNISACLTVEILDINDSSYPPILLEFCAESISIFGCTDNTACNYNPQAFEDDGSCSSICFGCIDPNANNYDSSANSDDGSCEYWGCMDPNAENYSAENNIDDGSCIYPGCTITWATNFDPNANQNDGSCTFELDGYVFYDGNLTGNFDGPDFGLAYQNVTLTPGDITVITDENGYYNFGVLPSGTYEVSVAENEIFPIQTTPLTYTVDDTALENTEDFNFGFADDDAYFAICVDFYPFVSGYPCNFFPVVHNICFRNMGTQTIDGVVQVDFDPLFGGYYEITPIDSVVGNSVYMSFENLMP
ncbi:MAG: hypothetical protein KDC12_15455, partial [Flavobacteriales bacterium]|nr:hypothetical protein [Flavobacteriales bacterium]